MRAILPLNKFPCRSQRRVNNRQYQLLEKEEEDSMKRFAIIGLVLLLAAGTAYAKGFEMQKKASEYDVTVTFDRNPPVASDNAVAIVIKDASGKIIKDATVKVEYSMPAMMGMPAMNYKADAALQGDEYKTTLGLSMSGSWNVAVKIKRAGKTTTMKFTVDAK